MKRPQRPMLALAGTYERKAHEGRLIELEAPGAVITQERLEALAALGFRESPPIQPFDGDLDSVEYLLHGFPDTFPAIAAAQDRMSLDNSLPRAKEGSFLQRLAQRRHHLLEVDAAIHSADRVEQHPRLHRRQVVGVNYTTHMARPSKRGSRALLPIRKQVNDAMSLPLFIDGSQSRAYIATRPVLDFLNQPTPVQFQCEGVRHLRPEYLGAKALIAHHVQCPTQLS